MNLNDKPAYQPWNEEEFSGDLLVSSMTPVQRWMYRTLLQKAFFYTTRPDLPLDEDILWRLAGCETRQQWEDNREAVLVMFSIEERDGEEVYYRKRLRQDWARIVAKRETQSQNGSKGADTRWNEAKLQPRGLPYKRMIPESCRKILGVRPEREEYYKKDLKELADTYGGTEVIEAFEAWAETVNDTPKNPIRDFIRVADGYLTNKVKQESPTLDALCVSLYHIGDQAFTGKHRSALNQMLSEFSFQEIERAYKTFVAGKNDYEMKFATRDFCEGGAKTIIQSTRKKMDDMKSQQTIMDEATEAAQQDVEKQLQDLEEGIETSL